jgi:glutathione synthase/RimK-type ligase-like ATP-grasp enzyme
MIYIADPNPWLALYAQPLHTRTAPPTADLQSFLSTYGRSQQQTCTLSRISPEIESDLTEALATLPESLMNTLNKSVLGIFFADGLGASGLTDMVALGDGSNNIGFIIVLDNQAFAHASANACASWKENSAFTADEEVQIQVCIANEDSDHRVQALRFLLLHEFGHVLATMTDICPKEWSFPLPKLAGHFSKHSWQTSGTKAIRPEQNFPHREKISFYRQPVLQASQALDLYRDLARTAFPTLYASMDVQEDFAECFATYVHTQLLGQPYRVQVKVGDALVFNSDDFWASSRASEKRRYFHHLLQSLEHNNARHTFQGLAPFLRMNLNGADLRSHAQSLLVQANQDQENAILWMNLATVFLCLKMRDMGLAIQEQALALQRLYVRPANCRRPTFRLLMIMTAGDLSENTPIDCLLENTPVELLYYYATVEQPLPSPLPEHDAVMVGLSDSGANRALLLAVQASLSGHAKPVINPPHLLPNVNRDKLSALLQDIPGLEMPRTHKLSRSQAVTRLSLQNQSKQTAPEAMPGFPLIIRPVGSQAGNNLARITSATELADYLKEVASPDFFVSRFVDYSSHDGQFRKYRIAMLRGEPFICHMAISNDWMVHYVNAGMYESAEKREEEGLFMQNFNRFATRHQAALSAIYERLQLDYLCIDCAETFDGKLLVFEIDHIMAVHAMDSASLFPFKAGQIAKLQHAFEQYLYTLQTQPLLESA